ncbi:MAG: hypothetical protein V1845_02130 [bacterium]
MEKGSFFSSDGQASLAGLEERTEWPAFAGKRGGGVENKKDELKMLCGEERSCSGAEKKACFFGNIYFVRSPHL